MPRKHPRQRCRNCDRHRNEVGDLSTRGYCQGCGATLRAQNLVQLVAHDGPYFDHWRARSLAALGVPDLDAPETST
jgi:hypothetical protein